nr:glycosyltransferase family 2 protein [uncultured Agathobacter sp.]
MSKLLTVVIPSYNVEKYIEKAVISMVENSFRDKLEILIVNDGSKDRTHEIGKQLEIKYPESVKLINKKNGGHGSTINTGIKIASGKYFKVIDGDDWVEPDMWERFLNKLDDIDADLILTPYNKVYENTNEIVKMSIAHLVDRKRYRVDDIISQIGDEYQIHSVTFNTEKVRKFINNRENCFYVDQEYILFPIVNISDLVYIDEAIYQYRLGDVNQSVSINSMQKNRKMHELVVYDILDFYSNYYNTLSVRKREFLSDRIYGLIYIQINIYLSLNSIDGLNECKLFLDCIRKKNEKIYNMIPGLTIKLMKLNMKFGYLFATKKYNKIRKRTAI